MLPQPTQNVTTKKMDSGNCCIHNLMGPKCIECILKDINNVNEPFDLHGLFSNNLNTTNNFVPLETFNENMREVQDVLLIFKLHINEQIIKNEKYEELSRIVSSLQLQNNMNDSLCEEFPALRAGNLGVRPEVGLSYPKQDYKYPTILFENLEKKLIDFQQSINKIIEQQQLIELKIIQISQNHGTNKNETSTKETASPNETVHLSDALQSLVGNILETADSPSISYSSSQTDSQSPIQLPETPKTPDSLQLPETPKIPDSPSLQLPEIPWAKPTEFNFPRRAQETPKIPDSPLQLPETSKLPDSLETENNYTRKSSPKNSDSFKSYEPTLSIGSSPSLMVSEAKISKIKKTQPKELNKKKKLICKGEKKHGVKCEFEAKLNGYCNFHKKQLKNREQLN